jgi:hypothetical protein
MDLGLMLVNLVGGNVEFAEKTKGRWIKNPLVLS